MATIYDGFVKSPISALRFIPLSLRRTSSTPHSAGFARLELGLFTKPSIVMTFYEFIIDDGFHFSNGIRIVNEIMPIILDGLEFCLTKAPDRL